MENAADALRIGAWVLIFVLALSVSINALTQAKQAADKIIMYNDREYDYSYITGNNANTQRTVSIQTIVPTIYRAYKENYKVILDEDTIKGILPHGLYGRWDDVDKEYKPIYYIDLEKEAVSDLKISEDDEDWLTLKEYFIRRILYGNAAKLADADKENWCKMQLSRINWSDTKYPINDKGLFGAIKTIEIQNKKLIEYLGVYYQEEAEKGATTTPNANKTEKRVITYKLN